jgi:hypothetical protein
MDEIPVYNPKQDTTIDDFKLFQTKVVKALSGFRVKNTDVSYVALDEKYWISLEEFLTLTCPPSHWSDFEKGDFGSWILPNGFSIVLVCGRWIDYWYEWDDPYYSTFQIHSPPRKPLVKYESKQPLTF